MFGGENLGGRAFGNNLSAMNTRTRPNIHDIIGLQNRVFVMLHHDHGIADVAQAFEGFEQAFIVALMQADGRLIQYIEHARQARPDLRSKTDPLAFSARQRGRAPRQCQIIKTHIHQEGQTVADFLQYAGGNFILFFAEMLGQCFRPAQGIAHRQGRDFANVMLADFNGQRFRFQAIAVTGRTGRFGHEFADFIARPIAVCFFPAAFEIGDDALKRFGDFIGPHAIIIRKPDFFFAGAVENGGFGLHR